MVLVLDKKINKVAGYRVMAGLNQTEMGKVLGITKQSYSNKERGVNQFNDSEKTKFKEFINDFFPGISIDEIFFS